MPSFSRREREIMDVMHFLGSATAVQIHAKIGEPPTYSSVRATLRRLEEKGHVRHRDRGHRNVYAPVMSNTRARKTAVRQLVDTYFCGSVGDAIAGLIEFSPTKKSDSVALERAGEALGRAQRKTTA